MVRSRDRSSEGMNPSGMSDHYRRVSSLLSACFLQRVDLVNAMIGLYTTTARPAAFKPYGVRKIETYLK